MTTENQFQKVKQDQRIEANLRKMKMLHAEYLSQNAKIVESVGPEIISTSASSFIIPVTGLFLSSLGLIALSTGLVPVTAGIVVGETLGLGSSFSVLGIKLASLLSPVRKSDLEDVERMTHNMFSIAFSAMGQLVDGNKGFKSLGAVGNSIDNINEMRSALKEMYGTKKNLEVVPSLFQYYNSFNDLFDDVGLIASSPPLTAIRSTDRPMTTVNIGTGPSYEKEIRERSINEKLEKMKKDKGEGEEEILRKRDQAFWDSYFQAVNQIHDFEQNTPTPPKQDYRPPQQSNIAEYVKYEPVKITVSPSMPNPYITHDSDNSSYGQGSSLGHGGSSTGEDNNTSDTSDIGEGPLG